MRWRAFVVHRRGLSRSKQESSERCEAGESRTMGENGLALGGVQRAGARSAGVYAW